MDEFWRMRTGKIPATNLPKYQHRRSATTDHRCEKPISVHGSLSPEDFTDVFSGPPRTVLARQSSSTDHHPRTAFSRCSFYEDIFRPPEPHSPDNIGRILPEFRIPGQSRRTSYGFYSKIFGWKRRDTITGHDRDDISCYNGVMSSRSRTKARTSFAFSSDELSPMRSIARKEDDDYGDDDEDDVSAFLSKLRPINVRSTWASSRTTVQGDCGNHRIDEIEKLRLSRNRASAETISLGTKSNGSFKMSADDLELPSDSSSVCETEFRSGEMENEIPRQEASSEQEEEEDDDEEVMSSYVIEINSDIKEGSCESNDIDEAIAWAKESFQRSCSETTMWSPQKGEKEKSTESLNGQQLSEGFTDSLGSSDGEHNSKGETGQQDIELQLEMQMIDERIRLWSTGKESDIRLLLSSLHHILWHNSGWLEISIANLIEVSKVKKAYQKARLCLHPDKLQQRGATPSHKYIADKAFCILQDAWASFVTKDAFHR